MSKTKEDLLNENAALTESLKEAKANLQAAKKALVEAPAPEKVVKAELNAEVAKEYELVNWMGSHKQTFGKHGVIDIATMTIAQAERLVKKGWPRLRKK